MKRMLALLLALTMMFSLAACGKNDTADSGAANNTAESGKTEDAGTADTGKAEEKEEKEPGSDRVIVNGVNKILGLDPTQIIVTVNGIDISLGHYLHQYVNCCLRVANSYSMYCIDQNGNFMWDTDTGDGQTVLEYILAATETSVLSYPLTTTLAQKHGIEITEDQRAALEENLAYEEEQAGSRRDYEADLALECLTYEDNYQMSESFYYYDGIMDLMGTEGSELYITDDELYSHPDIAEGMIMADHILLKKTGEAEQDAKLQEAMGVMQKLLKDAKDTRELVEMFSYLGNYYSEDEGRAYYPEGYAFVEGEMVDAFWKASVALEEYEVSDIVESEYGYHLIMRKPLRDYIKIDKYEDLMKVFREESEVVWHEEVREQIDHVYFFEEYTNWLERVQASSVVTG